VFTGKREKQQVTFSTICCLPPPTRGNRTDVFVLPLRIHATIIYNLRRVVKQKNYGPYIKAIAGLIEPRCPQCRRLSGLRPASVGKQLWVAVVEGGLFAGQRGMVQT
jgi:hypothetical protein